MNYSGRGEVTKYVDLSAIGVLHPSTPRSTRNPGVGGQYIVNDNLEAIIILAGLEDFRVERFDYTRGEHLLELVQR